MHKRPPQAWCALAAERWRPRTRGTPQKTRKHIDQLQSTHQNEQINTNKNKQTGKANKSKKENKQNNNTQTNKQASKQANKQTKTKT